MSRPLRIEYPGALYHVTSRGDRKENIYKKDADRYKFLDLLNKTSVRFNWVVHAYCLMDNHYHILLETLDGNLSSGMRQLNGIYTQSYNRTHHTVGHVFQGRYKSILVEKDAYLLELSRYIVLNPVRAKMVFSAESWPWSSYRQTIDMSNDLDCLEPSWLLSLFSSNISQAIDGYKHFVGGDIGECSPFNDCKNQIFLGSAQFVAQAKSMTDRHHCTTEIPQFQRRPDPDTLARYVASSFDRNTAIVRAYMSGGYTYKEIGVYFNLHFSTVAGIVRSQES